MQFAGIPDVLKNFAVFVDGFGQFGLASEVETPKLVEKTEDLDNGGLGGTIKVPMKYLEAMEMTFTFSAIQPYVLKQAFPADVSGTPLTLRAADQASDGKVNQIVISTFGAFREVEMGNMQVSKVLATKMKFFATAYKLTKAGDEIYDIDLSAMIWKVNGKDLMAEIRQAIGR